MNNLLTKEDIGYFSKFIYKENELIVKHSINKLREYINNDNLSKSILNYNKRKLSNKLYLSYLRELNEEGLVKYKGKNVEKLFVNIDMSGDYIRFGYDSNNRRLKVLEQYIEKHTLAPLHELSKSRKNAIKLSAMINYINLELDTRLFFITLTIPNVKICKLPETIENMNKNFRLITTSKKYKKFGVNYIKKIESTYNSKTNEAHPHFHFIFEIPKIVEIDEFWLYLRLMWARKYPKINTLAQDIREFDLRNPMKAAQEIATYTAKGSDYLNHGYEVFKYFYLAFHNKSNLTFNGFFRELNKMYKNDELEEYLPDEFKKVENITHIIELKWNPEERRYLIKVGEVSNYNSFDERINVVMNN